MPCHGSSLSAAQIEPQSSGKAPALLLSTAWRRRPRRTHRSPVAQLVEQAAVNRWVAGSSPARGAKLLKGLSPKTANRVTWPKATSRLQARPTRRCSLDQEFERNRASTIRGPRRREV